MVALASNLSSQSLVKMAQKSRRYFVFGDIHGCVEELHFLLKSLPLTPDSCLVFLGDYIDRGNYSRQVVDLILEMREQYEVIALMGNHEEMLLEFLEHPESALSALFILNGGSATLASYSQDNGQFQIPKEHLEFFRELKHFHETENYFFVHAGVPEIPLTEISLEEHSQDLLWIRAPFLNSHFDWGKLIIHGHSARKEPEVRPNRINLDTGCVYNGRLTALELPVRKFYGVDKIRKNENPSFMIQKQEPRVAVRYKGSIKVVIDPDLRRLQLETINYNQFGLLLGEFNEAQTPSLKDGEQITGLIGEAPERQIHFEGVVVRTESRGSGILYGVKVERISTPGEGLPAI